MPIFILVPVTVALLAAVLRRRGGAAADLGWKPRALVPDIVPPPRIGEMQTTTTARPAATYGQVAGALARVEARQWLASAWFAVGVGFCVMLIALFGWFWASAEDSGGR